jgi:alcohol dehydrogenase class IV
MRFEFATAARIVFGSNTLRELPPLVRDFGTHALVVTGRDTTRAAPLRELLSSAGLRHTAYAVASEPTTDDAVSGVRLAHEAGCDVVIGFGGGSALDAAKAIAGLATNPGDVLDYLEVVGRGQPLTRPGLPCIAIPTTAGTGAEVTRNAVLAVPERQVKVSLRSAHVLPRLALVDPVLTHALPPAITAASGLDALTQLIEPYLSGRANPLADALCVDGLRRVARSLRTACAEGKNATAREDMALASLFGGLALANAGLGAVHGFAGPIGGMFSAPHGAICATLLPHVFAANLQALRDRAPLNPALRRSAEVARLLTGRDQAAADDAVCWLHDLVSELRIPRLSTYGITAKDFPAIVAAAAQASSMKANPLLLTNEELTDVLEAAL